MYVILNTFSKLLECVSQILFIPNTEGPAGNKSFYCVTARQMILNPGCSEVGNHDA